ncbi:MAG: hypothetical protein CVU39_18315 [Chloroflexi bacterium HGW-Chloroflexi-10]|nr:MAG: hypothetical protein CVU39_18315 [Chloroflexi bacterium HGW-Chloroflexi-10]
MKIQFSQVSKKILSDIALDQVSFEFPEMGLSAILGDFGSGKSTILSLILGNIKPDSGEIFLNNKINSFGKFSDAYLAGIGYISSETKILNELTLQENLNLSRKTKNLHSKEKIIHHFLSLTESEEFLFNLSQSGASLSIEQRILFEVIRLAAAGCKLILMDEPLDQVPPENRKLLLEKLKKVADLGYHIVFTTYQPENVPDFCDYCVVLKRGKISKEFKDGFDFDVLSLAMSTDIKFVNSPSLDPGKNRVCEFINLQIDPNNEEESINYTLYRGQIAAVTGDDEVEMIKLLFCSVGLQRPTYGKILINGFDITNRPLDEFINDGVAFIPEDRLSEGLVPGLTIFEHFGLVGDLAGTSYKPLSLLKDVDLILKNSDIKHSGTDLIQNLSMRDLTKVLFALLPTAMAMLVIVHPTKKLDKYHKDWVWQQIQNRAAAGVGVIVMTQNQEEIKKYAHSVWQYKNGNWLTSVPTAAWMPNQETNVQENTEDFINGDYHVG